MKPDDATPKGDETAKEAAKAEMLKVKSRAAMQKLAKLGYKGEDAVKEFKSEHWVDATISAGYVKDILSGMEEPNPALKGLADKLQKKKPTTTTAEALTDKEKQALLDAINASLPKGATPAEELTDEAIVADKRANWVDNQLTDSVMKRIDAQYERAMAAEKKAEKSSRGAANNKPATRER